ncbi:bleomycin resistance protein [Arthrobacter sp. CAU 1506]|uniref:VOC family protein n=1 Tax=Arthrobacter sp. CAU 1506 TaxID=2560052 RepID=UPI0010ACA9FE|nr:VOC family protein [Arthrobacter sp. CAU 1506]TJY71387.1 bleomycin resistance protein [Arthrobacter sp. CAU 1506]
MASKLAAYLSYADAPAAIAWLEAIGFKVVARKDGPGGRVVHSELRLDEVVVMVASDDSDYVVAPLVGRSTGAGLYVVRGDVDQIYTAAVDAGGVSVFRPEDTEWGTRRARVLDPGGREWSFGSYQPGVGW